MKGHGLYMNKTSINPSISLSHTHTHTLYDAKLNVFIPFFLWLCIKLYVHPFMKGHGLYMNKTSINQSISLSLSLTRTRTGTDQFGVHWVSSLPLFLHCFCVRVFFVCLSVGVSLSVSVCHARSLSLLLWVRTVLLNAALFYITLVEAQWSVCVCVCACVRACVCVWEINWCFIHIKAMALHEGVHIQFDTQP